VKESQPIRVVSEVEPPGGQETASAKASVIVNIGGSGGEHKTPEQIAYERVKYAKAKECIENPVVLKAPKYKQRPACYWSNAGCSSGESALRDVFKN